MKLNVGTLRQFDNGVIEGRAALIGTIAGDLRLVPNPRYEAGEHYEPGREPPNFNILYRSLKGGGFYHVGGAWLRESKNETEYLSLSLCGPRWDRAVYLAAFARDGGKDDEGNAVRVWDVIWSPPKGAVKDNAEQDAAAA